ncbi:MAG TPA: response regulator transcription factor [Thioalkalivibrio sp.]|nr:response regulator transcription factor [Thioalkalivibrio sp.]
MRILIIEDEASLREQVRERLAGEGYMVDTSADGEDGLYQASEFPFDLAIVDLGLPGVPGLDVIRRLREAGSRLPILVLTARGKWDEKVAGLEAGADDYLVKPFHMEELLARVRALLRRSAGAPSSRLCFGPFVLDLQGQRLLRDEAEVGLTGFEYRMLEYFVRNRERVVSKAELADYLYPHDEDPDSNVIEVLMGRLRRKLDPDNSLKPIDTLRGRGYRFALETRDE